MNKVFLYAAKDSTAYRQVEEYLTNMSFNGKLIILPPGSQFSSTLCLQLRSNDLFVLFAANNEEIDELVALHDEYECFKIILIVKDEEQTARNTFTLLSPRLISYLDNSIDDVGKYLVNIFKKS